MSENIDMTPRARWLLLQQEGLKLLIDLQSNEKINGKPSWLDEERFAKAKAAVQKYFIGISYSSFVGLLLILQLPDGLEPLLSTGNSKDIPSLFRRYVSTITHVNSWYDDDIFDPSTKGYKSIRQVRGMHKRVQSLMNDKFNVVRADGRDKSWLCQYEMAMTQFAFIGLAMLYPEKCGMIGASKEELESINYYWRVLGFMMGLEDEFNACQFDKYEDIHEFNRQIFENGYKIPFQQTPCEKGLKMTQSICVALHYFMPVVTFNQLAHWWKDEFSFNGYELEKMSTRDRLCQWITQINFSHLFKYDVYIRLATKMQRKKFARRLKNKEKVYEKLKAQYEGNDKFTYYSDRCDYFKAKNDTTSSATENVVGNNNSVNTDNKITDSIKNEGDGNNNNYDEKVYNKANGCPFGYGATTISPPISNQETAAIS